MRTPPLRGRVVAAGVSVVAVVLVALDVFLYLSLRSTLLANLSDVLDERVAIVRQEAPGRTASQLADRLTELGLGAEVRAPGGAVFPAEPPSPRLGDNLAPPAGAVDGPAVTRAVDAGDGVRVVVRARRSGVDQALRRLVGLEVLGTVVGVGLATALLARAAGLALRPVEELTAAARRAAGGHRGERLHPDRPHTGTGEMAAAFDQMLDALEESIAEARAAAGHSRVMEERARKVVETATDAFVTVALDGTVVEWNEGAERTFGIPRAEAVGRDAFDTLFPPERREEHRARLDRLRDTGERRSRGRRLETVATRAGGSTFPAELVLWASGDGEARVVNAFVHDLTERRAAEEDRFRLAAIVDSSDDAVVGHDLDGTVVTWNGGAERMFGYPAEEVVGRPLTLLVPPERHEEVTRTLEMVRRGERVPPHETVRLPRHGPPLDVSVVVSPIRDEAGAVTGASSIARDTTELHWLARTLDRTLGALDTALGEARASEERSRRFLADAAHQLRTPVAGIRACAETLLRGPAPAERDRLLADIVRETYRASRLMAALLKIARLDRGVELAPAPCDLGALCRDEAARARVLAPDLDVAVDTARFDGRAELDADAVREIVANLIDNARRHARSRIAVAVESEAGAVRVRVDDDGPGVAEGMEERIFERFVSLDRRGGSGLGLPIARDLARAHGGDLAYEDGVFLLRLPSGATTGEALAAPSA